MAPASLPLLECLLPPLPATSLRRIKPLRTNVQGIIRPRGVITLSRLANLGAVRWRPVSSTPAGPPIITITNVGEHAWGTGD
jgi:hypothetical protein